MMFWAKRIAKLILKTNGASSIGHLVHSKYNFLLYHYECKLDTVKRKKLMEEIEIM